MKKIITLGLLLTINLMLFSQVSSEKRIEFSLKEDFEKEFVHPVKENGLVVISSSKNKTNGNYEWKFDLYNTNLGITKSSVIETDFSNDETKYSSSNLDYWYDDYFVAYGQQKIKNKTSESDKKKRYVYFINKIKF